MLPIVTYHDMKTGQPPKAHKSRSIYSHIENLETRTKLGYRHVQFTGVYTHALFCWSHGAGWTRALSSPLLQRDQEVAGHTSLNIATSVHKVAKNHISERKH